MNMRVSPDMPTRRREPNPMTCVSIPMHARSVLLAHAVGEPDLAVVLKGLCVLSLPRHTQTCRRVGVSRTDDVLEWVPLASVCGPRVCKLVTACDLLNPVGLLGKANRDRFTSTGT